MGTYKKFKKGMASFYIVAFSTLILVIVATSFATVVISEIARTSNDDLSQSAYDAAMAGVEDAKLAYANYLSCLKIGVDEKDVKAPDGDGALSCAEIVWLMRNPDCDMVARILGRIEDSAEYNKNENNEIIISETSGNSNMNQAYTCVKINTTLSDYRTSLSSSNPYKVVKVKLGEGKAKDVSYIKLSWYSNLRDVEKYNFNNFNGSRVVFKSLKEIKAPTPPTLSLELIQTAESFTMGQLNGQASSDRTDRATVYLVPSDSDEKTEKSDDAIENSDTYVGVRKKGSSNNESKNEISSEQVASTNNLQKNLPYLVYCPKEEDNSGSFACSVEIKLPNPVGGSRNDDTFMLIVSLPYGQPDTDFAIEFFCDTTNIACSTVNVGGDEESVNDGIMEPRDMQVSIDSTGRANDLFRRVELRMEASDASFSYPMYAIEASGKISKDISSTKEYGVNEPESEPEQNIPSVLDDESVGCMQDFPSAWFDINSMTVKTVYKIKDCRDNEYYNIAKLGDGNVWMLDNLRLNLVESEVLNSISSANTNASSDSLNILKNNMREWQTNQAAAYDVPLANISRINDVVEVGKVGVYYNYCAASAGSYCYQADDTDHGNATQDICPSGWRIPSIDEYKLFVNNNDGSVRNDSYGRFIASGYYDSEGTLIYNNEVGGLWSSSWKTSDTMYRLVFRKKDVYHSPNGKRNEGLNIRCLLKNG